MKSNFKRDYKLTMPQLLSGGLSENWILKEFGDIHWEMISESLGSKSDAIIDSNGERLYASFVRLQWTSNKNLFAFKENEKVSINGKISRFGNKMFFSEENLFNKDKKINASLMSVFSSRAAGDNEKLTKGKPLNSEKTKLKELKKLPEIAKGFFDTKTSLFATDNDEKNKNTVSFYNQDFVIKKEPLFTKLYGIDPYDDINGVGLLYFASYPKINDKCERFFFQEYETSDATVKNWAQNSYCIARDIHYYGNANANDELIYELEDYIFISDTKIQLTSSLYRSKDQQLIAKIFTVKEMLKPIKLGFNKQAKKQIKRKIQEQKKVKTTPVSFKEEVQNTIENKYSREELNTIALRFFNKMFDGVHIDIETDLRQIGVESITLTELSEYLNVTHALTTNPSKLFGLYSVNEIVSYLLGDPVSSRTKEENATKSVDKHTALEDVAIVGISFRVPGATTKEGLWKLLSENKSAITKTPKERLDWSIWKDVDPKYKSTFYGGYIDDIDKFDANFFGISPQEARLMDPQHRIVLESVYAALEDAAIPSTSLRRSDTGVFMGVSGADYATFRRNVDKESIMAYDAIGASHAILANRISYLLDIHGPSKAIDTACSSSLIALHEAVKSIQDSSCKQAIVGGVNAILNPELTLSYNNAGMLSEDGSCKTFDERANGYVRSEGVGIIILKKLSEAEKNGDIIYGAIKGSAINHGGRANTLTTPNAVSQKNLLVKAYESAGIKDPKEVSYLEAHGTGTPLGDPIEIEGIKGAFEALYKENNTLVSKEKHCGIGSIKTNVGHLEAAAGVVGLIKVLLSMQHKALPGNPHLKNQNKYIELNKTPFYLTKKTSDWKMKEGAKRIAGISSFGFGGANAHIVIEEYTSRILKKHTNKEPKIILLSANTEEQLKERMVQLEDYLEVNESVNLSDVAYTLQVGRVHMKMRLAFKVTTLAQLKRNLSNYLKGKLKKGYTNTIVVASEKKVEQLDLEKLLKEKNADQLMDFWSKGYDINWMLLYKESKPNKIALPTYPFARERYWIEDAVSSIELSKKDKKNSKEILSVDDFIVNQICEFVHIKRTAIDKEEFISDYGIDSIQINQLANAINSQFDLEIRPMELQSYLTVVEIEAFITEELKNKIITEDLPVQEQEEIIEDGTKLKSEDIAIIGLDMEISDADSLEGLKELLSTENYKVTSFPEKRWEAIPKHYTKGLSDKNFKGKFLDGILNFDHKLFKISIREAMLMDPQHRLLLHSVWRSIENAGYTKTAFSKKRTAVFVAINGVDYSDIVKYDDHVDEFSGRGVKRYIGANRISNFFDLSGVSETIDTACSSFFVGVKKAIDAIRRGECDQAIISGVQANLLPFTFQEQLAQGILTSKERTLPFDSNADGYVRAEGVCSIIIKGKDLAKFDKDQIYGYIKGGGIAHGGRSLNVTSPNVSSHKQAFTNALDDSGVNINSIAAIETHGTGMPFGDESELQAFEEVFKERERTTATKCIIGAAKSSIGHLEAASGGLAILKSIITLQQGEMNGIKGINKIHPNCNSQKFSISSKNQKLIIPEKEEATIGLHSYGIGGLSAFLILEKTNEEHNLKVVENVENVFVLSAQSAFVLQKYATDIKEYLQENSTQAWFNLNHFLASYQLHREGMKIRLAIVIKNVDELITSLSDFIDKTPNPLLFGSSTLNIPITEKSKLIKNPNALAQQWVDMNKVDWKITSINRYSYPNYPMDKRRSFWISNKQEKESTPYVKKEKQLPQANKFLMLEI